jgi:hypothetical protein
VRRWHLARGFVKPVPEELRELGVTEDELRRVQVYLRDKFGNAKIRLRDRTQSDESVEVFIGDEFVGVIYRDEDDGEVSYDFNMAILAYDLPPAKEGG